MNSPSVPMGTNIILPFLNPSSNEAIHLKNGQYRYKHSVRAFFRSASLLTLVAIFCIYNFVTDGSATSTRRRLEDESTGGGFSLFQDKIDPPALIVVYIIGILYMLLALVVYLGLRDSSGIG